MCCHQYNDPPPPKKKIPPPQKIVGEGWVYNSMLGLITERNDDCIRYRRMNRDIMKQRKKYKYSHSKKALSDVVLHQLHVWISFIHHSTFWPSI